MPVSRYPILTDYETRLIFGIAGNILSTVAETLSFWVLVCVMNNPWESIPVWKYLLYKFSVTLSSTRHLSVSIQCLTLQPFVLPTDPKDTTVSTTDGVTAEENSRDQWYDDFENLSEPPDAGEIDENSDSSDFEDSYIKKKKKKKKVCQCWKSSNDFEIIFIGSLSVAEMRCYTFKLHWHCQFPFKHFSNRSNYCNFLDLKKQFLYKVCY